MWEESVGSARGTWVVLVPKVGCLVQPSERHCLIRLLRTGCAVPFAAPMPLFAEEGDGPHGRVRHWFLFAVGRTLLLSALALPAAAAEALRVAANGALDEFCRGFEPAFTVGCAAIGAQENEESQLQPQN